MKCDICRQVSSSNVQINLGEGWTSSCPDCHSLICRFVSELISEGILREQGLIKPYKFWYESSRAKRYEEVIELSSDLTDDQLKDYAEDWVRENYPNFYGTEAMIHYGWDNV